MATATGPKCKLCRREGEKLFLKGDRCSTQKCAMVKKKYAPGIHGQTGQRNRGTEYGKQLRAKQKAKRIYGILERQFQNYFKKADSSEGVTGEILLQLLERRLDNVVFRLGLAPSRRSARQYVSHGLIEVNGTKVTAASFQVREADVIAVRASKEAKKPFENLSEQVKNSTQPAWLHLDESEMKGKVLHVPTKEEIDHAVEIQLIVEFYSR